MNFTAKNQNTPLSFKEWKQTSLTTNNEESYLLYNDYLKNWYSTNNTATQDNNLNLIRQRYLDLLQKIQIFFSQEELENWYKTIDLNNRTELLLSIPYFSKKIKEIGLYFLKQREEIKKIKSKSELAGTDIGLEKLLYNYILTAFSKKNYSIGVAGTAFYKELPELEQIANNLQINIEELYDTYNYLDQTNEIPVSQYYNLTGDTIVNYLSSNSFDLDATEWLYSTGIPSVTGLDDFNLNYLQKQKYLGNSLYTLNAIKNYSNNTAVLSAGLTLNPGSNLFYWLTSFDNKIIDTENLCTPISINNSDFVNIDTNETQFPNADKIYKITRAGDRLNIEGAWLQNIGQKKQKTYMLTTIPANKETTFRFPYPGYGLQGEQLPWTGPSLTDNNTLLFNTLDKATRDSIITQYWNYTFPLTSFDPLYIQEIAMPNGNANVNFVKADQLIVTLSGTKQSYWLYSPSKTDLSITDGQNRIYWPLYKVKTDKSTFPININSNYCLPVQLSSLSVAVSTGNYAFAEATPGLNYGDGDIIYKLNSYNDTIDQAVEIAWLSGSNIGNFVSPYVKNKKITGPAQPGFNLISQPGQYTPFIWSDVAATRITQLSSVFKHIDHSPDCEYLQQELKSLYSSTILTPVTSNGSQFKACTCKAVNFSPLGHNGTLFTDYKGYTDYIVTDDLYFSFYNASNGYPNSFNLPEWLKTFPYLNSLDTNTLSSLSGMFTPQYALISAGSTYTSLFHYMTSQVDFGIKNLAWYKLTGTDVEVGWEKGNWVDYYGNMTTMQLTAGTSYYYFRTNLNRDTKDTANLLPYYVARYKPKRRAPAIWAKAVLSSDGNWHNAGVITDMVINPGDFLIYQHTNSFNVTMLTSTLISQTTSTNFTNSVWSTYDYVTPFTTINVGVPASVPVPLPTDPQYTNLDKISLPDLTSVDWQVDYKANMYGPVTRSTYFVNKSTGTSASSSPVQYFTSLLFTPASAGVYYISLTANHNSSYNTRVVFLSTIVPPITCVPNIVKVTGQLTRTYPKANFVLNVQLSGWDTNLKAVNPQAANAMPYWAEVNSTNGLYYGNDYFYYADDYNLLTQPTPADGYLYTGQEITYINRSTAPIKWLQPLTYNLNTNTKQWNQIVLLSGTTVPIASSIDYTGYINQTTITYPLTTASNLVLESYFAGDLVKYIYFTNQPSFTLNLQFSTVNTNFHLAASSVAQGGSALYVSPVQPYANLTNRHTPSIASMQNIDSLYSVRDIGGYFTPKNLGALTYSSNNVYTANFDTIGVDTLSGIVRKESYELTDRGLSQKDSAAIQKLNYTDSTWLKETPFYSSSLTNPVISKNYQKFLGYQSKQETSALTKDGLVTKDYKGAPWKGSEDDLWLDTKNYPFDFRGIANVQQWKDNQILQYSNQQLYKWTSDVFGNQYGLYKDIASLELQQQKDIYGTLWIKNLLQEVVPATAALSAVYKNYSNLSIYSDLTSNTILDVEIFHDVLYLRLPAATLFIKINYDYNTGKFTSTLNDSNYVSYNDEKGYLLIEDHYTPTGLLLQDVNYPSLKINSITPFVPGGVAGEGIPDFWTFTNDQISYFDGMYIDTSEPQNTNSVTVYWGDGTSTTQTVNTDFNHRFDSPFFQHNASPGSQITNFDIQTDTGEEYNISWGDGNFEKRILSNFNVNHTFNYLATIQTKPGNEHHLVPGNKIELFNSNTNINFNGTYTVAGTIDTRTFYVSANTDLYNVLALSGGVTYTGELTDKPAFFIGYEPVPVYNQTNSKNAILHLFNDYRFIDNWFIPSQSKIVVGYYLPQYGFYTIESILPIIYEFNIGNFEYKKVFPLIDSDLTQLNGFKNLGIVDVTSSCFTYNNTNNTAIFSLMVDVIPQFLKYNKPFGQKIAKKIAGVMINFYIQKSPDYKIKDIEVIYPNENAVLLQENFDFILQENYLPDYYDDFTIEGTHFLEIEQ